MKKRHRRYSCPLRCCFSLCLLLFLVWALRLVSGPPPGSLQTLVRRTEKRCLRLPGELTEVLDEGARDSAAVTWREGELYTYRLSPTYTYRFFPGFVQVWKNRRYRACLPYRGTDGTTTFWCTTPELEQYIYTHQDRDDLMNRSFCILVKQEDPAVTSGELTIRGKLEEDAYTWKCSAVRTDSRYLLFSVELERGGPRISRVFSAMCSGRAEGAPVTAEAEAVLWNEAGEEVERVRFSLLG